MGIQNVDVVLACQFFIQIFYNIRIHHCIVLCIVLVKHWSN